MTEPIVIRMWGPDRRLLFPFPFPGVIRVLPVLSVIASTTFLVVLNPHFLPPAWSPFRALLLLSLGAHLGLISVLIFGSVFAQPGGPEAAEGASGPAVLVDWRYVPLALAFLTIGAIAYANWPALRQVPTWIAV